MRRAAIARLVFFWLAVAPAAQAQDCLLPLPFAYHFENAVSASIDAASVTDPCKLSVATSAGAGPVAAGFLHYRRPQPLTWVRYSLRVDSSALTGFAVTNRRAQLFSASSPVVLGDPAVSQLLQLSLAGGSPPVLIFRAAGPVATRNVAIEQTLNTVRVEIQVGAGAAGLVRYWINHEYTDAPDGVIDNDGAGLDNLAWLGVIGAEIGLSSPTANFRADQAGHALVFDQIESSDDLLFWTGFETATQ